MAFFTEIEKKETKIFMESQEIPESQSNLEKKRTKLEASHFLISNCTIKL